jgi:KaiC/GvpD/RAD55 family RecA-like ATPase
MVMVIDPFTASNLKIKKYLARHRIEILDNIQNSLSSAHTCDRDKCLSSHELIMIKELKREDDLFFKNQLNEDKAKDYIIDNGHILNMLMLKLVDKKMFKEYMREFKKRRHKWTFRAIVVRNKQASTPEEKRMSNELNSILKQSQIDYVMISNIRTLTLLRKEVYKNLQQYL